MPKGGVKYENIPLTFSYLGLAFVAAPMLILSASRRAITILHLLTFFAICPFAVIASSKVAFYGGLNLGHALSLIANSAVIPCIFLLAMSGPLQAFDHQRVQRFFVAVVTAVALFGLVEFAARNYLKIAIEIPYVTVNADDLGSVALKHNDRGKLIKLVSTYQNGNIFGVCMLLVGPLFFHFTPGRWLIRGGFLVATFLSLSRTAWAGMFVWLILWELVYHRKLIRLILRSPIYLCIGSVAGAIGVWLLAANLEFLFDRTLGGRLGMLESLNVTWLGDPVPYHALGEMTYISVFEEFGLVGTLCFLLWLAAPVLAHILIVSPGGVSQLERACQISLITYWVVAVVDGAFALIPVVAIYWLIATIMLSARRYTLLGVLTGPGSAGPTSGTLRI